MLFVVCTFLLIALGGTVTSKQAGLAVPDYPTTFGYHMFAVPFHLWIGRGGVFWEHSHRLMGSLVGMLAIVMLFWMLLAQRRRKWLSWLSGGTLAAVTVQGLLGGLRVTEIDVRYAVAHGIAAQVILCLTVLIAAGTSQRWIESTARPRRSAVDRTVRNLSVLPCVLLGVLFIQLILGVTMRHGQAALAIPDFPGSYGGLVPPLTHQDIQDAIDQLPYENDSVYYSPAQVGVHYAHRVWAFAVCFVGIYVVTRVLAVLGKQRGIKGPAIALLIFLPTQILLGALVIWTQRHAEIATAHQATGAAILATATLLTIRVRLTCPNATRLAERTACTPVAGALQLGRVGT